VVALIALCVAVVQIRQSSRIHRAQTRPYIVPEVVLHKTARGRDALYLQLSNFGKTPARGITVQFPAVRWNVVKRVQHPLDAGKPAIALLAPGASITYFLGQTNAGDDFLSAYAAGFEVGVTYVDASGTLPVTETYPLKWDTTYVRQGD
jgi:hypothetical protein